jgi:inosine/xanthosine triphosphate pyrophosphatase family protein
MKKFNKIVVATKNPAKTNYYRSILDEIADEVLSLNDFGFIEKPNESGSTAEENAYIKARHYAKETGLPVFSEDEALYVDFLPESEQPGTHVRRINGHDEVDDDQLLKHWEDIISKVPVGKRAGRWHIAYCIFVPNGQTHTVALDHSLVFFSPSSKIRLPGWPMSSLEGPTLFNKPNSELTEAEKEITKKETTEELHKILKKLL